MITISAKSKETRRDAMKRGRKSKYETNVKPRFDDIKQWAENGMSERDMAGNLDVHYSTFIEYKGKFPELNELLKKSRKHPVDDIKAAMLKRAKGFQFIEKKVIRQYIEIPDDLREMLDDNGIDVRGYEKPQLVRTEETLKTAVPDVAAGLVLLQHWDKNEDGTTKWSRDPAKLELQKEELELKRLKTEEDYW